MTTCFSPFVTEPLNLTVIFPIKFLETAAQAVEAGVGAVSIMDGRVSHCILRALSGEIFGTSIVK